MFHRLNTRPNPTFKIFDKIRPGVDQLDASLTINGTTVTPTFRYKGGDADTTDWNYWGYGEDLTYNAGGGAVSVNQGSPLLGANDDSVLFDGNAYYNASGNSLADITTEDIVLEFVFNSGDLAATYRPVSKYVGTTGWEYYIVTSGAGAFSIHDGTDFQQVIHAALDANTWYHVVCFINRNEASANGSQIYVNGIASGAGVDMSTAADTITSATKLSLGSRNGVSSFPSNIAYCAMWKQSDWHQAGAAGPAEWATIAKERFLKLTGFYPQKASGTAVPTVMTRASQAYLDKVEPIEAVEVDTTNIVTDGDMEAAGVGDWNGSSVTVSKETGTRTGGSGTQIIRGTYSSFTNGYFRQTTVAPVVGKKYRVTGWARGDGTNSNYPNVRDGNGASLFSGTNSTDWQYFDVVYTAAQDTLRFYNWGGVAGDYVEFDDIQVYEIPSEYNKENLLSDGAMEQSDASEYTAEGSSVLTKETGTRTGGSGTLVLRVANPASGNALASQTILTVGEKYRLTGWSRSDGNQLPTLRNPSGTVLWTGTTSTDWQYFDVIFTAATNGKLFMGTSAAGSGQYCEFDDITIYEIPTGATDENLLSDGAMESSNTDEWTAQSSATLSKESGARINGTGTQILRIARNAVNNPYATQSILTVGQAYRVTGWARGDGTARPEIYFGTSQIWVGTTSTDWQYIDAVGVHPDFGTQFRLWVQTSSGTTYAEFDDITLTQLPDRHLYQVGDEWLRYAHRQDANGDSIRGYLPEPEVENLCIQSETFGSWAAPTRAYFVDGYLAPNRETTADVMIEDGTLANSHLVISAAIAKTDAVVYTFSVFAKAANRTWVRPRTVSGPDAHCYFDVENGVVGTETNCTGYIENWGNGWFRCIMVFTSTATGNTNMYIYIAEDDADPTFDGLNQDSLYLWGAQFEAGEYASSYIPTVAAAVTKLKDELTYKGDDGNLGGVGSERKGTSSCDLLFPNIDTVNNSTFHALSDGGAAADQIGFRINSGDKARLNITSTGGEGAVIDTADTITDNVIHKIEAEWQVDFAATYDDRVQGNTDTAVDISDDLDQIDVGQTYDNTGQFNGIISSLEFTKTPLIERIPKATFKLFDHDTIATVDNLDPLLTINGTTVTPTLRYKGGDADITDWNYWGYGEDLDYVANGGAVSVNQGSPLLGTNDDSVKGDGLAYYTADNTSFGDIATEDIVFEIVFKVDTAMKVITGKWSSAPGNAFWYLYFTGSSTLNLIVNDNINPASNVNSATLDAGTWYHAVVFVNRDEGSTNGSQIYINGVASGSGTDFSGSAASLSNSLLMNLGSMGGGTAPYDSNIAYIAMWKQASWHQAGAAGPTEWATIAQERFLKLTGFWPQHAEGTFAPTVITRASQAYLDKLESGVRKLYRVGDNWLRCVDRNDSVATNIKGYLPEAEVENALVQSETFNTWSTFQSSIVADQTAAPNKEVTADIIHEDDTAATQHYINNTFTGAGSTQYTYSCWIKKGNRDWALLQMWSASDFTANAYFDLTNGVVGTTSAVDEAGIENWGNGWFRCWFSDTRATAESHTVYIYAAEADADITFDGLDQDSIYVWGAQVEAGDYPSSYIPTVAAAITRSADQLKFKGDDGNITNNQIGTFHCNYLLEDFTNATDVRNIARIVDDTDATNDRIQVDVRDTDRIDVNIRASGGNAGDLFVSDDTTDGYIHSTRLIWKTDDTSIYSDDGTPGSDATADIPNDLDRIDVGSVAGNFAFGGVITGIKIYDAIKKP
jgi:hypothetical protein